MTGKHHHLKVLRSEYWRQRAYEAREAIKDISNLANKKILEEVARSYEEMAELVGGHERSAGSPPSQPPAAGVATPNLRLRSAPLARDKG